MEGNQEVLQRRRKEEVNNYFVSNMLQNFAMFFVSFSQEDRARRPEADRRAALRAHVSHAHRHVTRGGVISRREKKSFLKQLNCVFQTDCCRGFSDPPSKMCEVAEK